MALTFPRTDIMAFVGYQPGATPLRLASRQELSRQANGITRGKDLGSAIWFAEFTTAPIPNDTGVEFEAMLNSLDGVINTFEAGDPRRPYPKNHSSGVFTDSGVLDDVTSNKNVRISGLPAAFSISVGDYLHFTNGGKRVLHQAVEAATANGSGITGYFEVRPHVHPGLVLSPPVAVTFKKPVGYFTMLPGSVESRGSGALHTVVDFKAVQYL